MNDAPLIRRPADESAMEALGAELAAAVTPGTVVHLQGQLGTGKTTLSRGFIHSLGHQGAVKSPTYTLVEPYQLGELRVYHFDLYRLGDAEELEFMGIRDYFDGNALCLVEWPERGQGVLPPADLVINIETEGAGRRVGILAGSARGRSALSRLRQDG